MSTTFDVYPCVREIPTFRALLERSTIELHKFLDEIGVYERPLISIRLMQCEDNDPIPFSLDDPARWGPHTYAWFAVGDVPGGTDSYFCTDHEIDGDGYNYWKRVLEDEKSKKYEPEILEYGVIDHCWYFRRSAGQSAVVNLAYGLIAGSLASMTKGFVYSDDSAWDWEQMPAPGEVFLRRYFRPDQTFEVDHREWTTHCIEWIREEIPKGSYPP